MIKKISVITVYILSAVLLTSCSQKLDATVDIEPTDIGNGTTNDNVSETVNPESQKREYSAKEDSGFHIIYDYDSALSLCNDICQEFVRAVRQHNKADFTPYISNENLQAYMQYRVDNYYFGFNEKTVSKLFITEVSFHDDYVLVGGLIGTTDGPDSSSLQGMNYFLIKNADGRLYIADWYWDAMDSPDVELRGEFSEENNLTYWDEPEKYESIMSLISAGGD